MQDVLEMTVSTNYNSQTQRRIRMLKKIRIFLIVGLTMAWIYGISVTVALLTDLNGAATQWLLFFAMFTLPATVLLVLIWRAITRFEREFDYFLTEEGLEICVSINGNRSKRLLWIKRSSMLRFGPLDAMPDAPGRVIRATCGSDPVWALDTVEDGFYQRILLQPNEAFRSQLSKFAKQ